MLGAWKTSRLLVLSPHLDDAVLSAGATIAAWGQDGRAAHVLTVFAGEPEGELSPAAGYLHTRCGLGEDAVAVRRMEDRAALERVGASPVHGRLLDAVYRRQPGGTWLCLDPLDVFVRSHPPDRQLEAAVLDLMLRTSDRIRPGLLLGPQALGDHVDHLVVRRAAVRASRLLGIPLLLWEDQPYVSTLPVPQRTRSVHMPYTPRTLRAKLDAVACYASQLPILWPGGDDWRGMLGEAGRAADGPAGEWFHHASNDPTSRA